MFNMVAILKFVFKTSKCTHVSFVHEAYLSMTFMRDVLEPIHQQSAKTHDIVPPETRLSSRIPCIVELCH